MLVFFTFVSRIMKLKEEISNRWLQAKLKGKLRPTKNFVNINQAKFVGLIWQEEDLHAIDYLLEMFQILEIKVEKIRFTDNVNDKEGTFTKKDFKFLGNPKKEELKAFIATPFDILFDITRKSGREIKIVRALSEARFKVGSSNEELNYLDFNIQLTENADAKFLAEQLLFYLEVINNAK